MKNLAATEVVKGDPSPDPLKPHDALSLLAADHEALTGMLREYEQSRRSASQIEKGMRALRICHLLEIHGAMEAEIFYPAVAAALGEEAAALLDDAEAEHDTLAALMAEVEHMAASDACFDSKMADLADHAIGHFKQEEAALFPKLRHAHFDLAGVGERLAARQLELATVPPDRHTFREGRRVMGSP